MRFLAAWRSGGRGTQSASSQLVAWSMAFVGALATWPGAAPSGVAALATGGGFVLGKALLFRGCGCLGAPPRRGDDRRIQVLAVSLVSSLIAALALALVRIPGLPAGVAVLDGVLSLALLSLLRSGPRLARARRRAERGERVALVGSIEALYGALAEGSDALGGHATLLLLDEQTLSLAPGARLRDVPVADPAELGARMARGELDRVTLVPPLSPSLEAWAQARCDEAAIPCDYVGASCPSLPSLRATLASCPERLLGRAPRQILTHAADRHVHDALHGRRVCIVGAGEALGRATAREVLRHQPTSLLLAERSPDALCAAMETLTPLATCELAARLLDAKDARAVSRLCVGHAPQVVLHAALPRHRELAEHEPAAFAAIHLLGARHVLDAAIENGAECFVYVSSHAAVNPTSVLGALTRLVERYLQARARRSSTRLAIVRLPGLLAADEEPLAGFLAALERGLPLTIAQADAERCFMTPPEAAQAVLETLAFGQGGEVHLPDVGEPVRPGELARRVLTCAGLREGLDTPVLHAEPRCSERLREPLAGVDESVRAADHPSSGRGTWVAIDQAGLPSDDSIGAAIDAVTEAARAGRDGDVVCALAAALPSFQMPIARRWRSENAPDAPPTVNLVTTEPRESGARR